MSSTADVVAALTGRFHADRAVGLSAVFQFVVTGDDGGTWHAAIANGACTVSAGDHASPGVTISASAVTWARIVAGTTDPQTAFLMGKVRVKGDMGLAMRLRSLFG